MPRLPRQGGPGYGPSFCARLPERAELQGLSRQDSFNHVPTANDCCLSLRTRLPGIAEAQRLPRQRGQTVRQRLRPRPTHTPS